MQCALFYPPLIAWAAVSLCLLLSPLHAQDLHITLLNGDCDGDNEVTLFDFGIVVSAMGSVPGDPNWDARADLDGDGEVTLFDYGIVERNFGQVGAEPFDPTLPRLPAPSQGYQISGMIGLEAWEGRPLSVRIEALREDDPSQVVYWMEVPTDTPFVMRLPQSGLWNYHIAVSSFGLSAAPLNRIVYARGDSIRVVAQYPSSGERFSVTVPPEVIPMRVRPIDYDDVYIEGGNPRTQLPSGMTQKEREVPGNLVCRWWLVSGQGNLLPGPSPQHDCLYVPNLFVFPLPDVVWIQCTIMDTNPDNARRDDAVTIDFVFFIVGEPTLHISAQADRGGTPVASGENTPIRVRFIAHRRKLAGWLPPEVRWDTPWGEFTGHSVETEPVPRDEPHRRFTFSATATFRPDPSFPYPPEPSSDSRTATCILGFHLNHYDEEINPARGVSEAGTFEPPNWFDARSVHNAGSGHWGNVVDRFDETDRHLAGGYVVYYAPQPFRGLSRDTYAIFDWSGYYAPQGHRYDPAYRGRIYIFNDPTVTRHGDDNPARPLFIPTAGGIDLVALAIKHEFAHRDWFLQDWGGFGVAEIGGTPPHYSDWKPGSRPFDRDGDFLSNDFEDRMSNRFRCHPDNPFSIIEWWTGVPSTQRNQPRVIFDDFEMLVRIWGHWGGSPPNTWYLIGSLDSQDWSVGGRQDY